MGLVSSPRMETIGDATGAADIVSLYSARPRWSCYQICRPAAVQKLPPHKGSVKKYLRTKKKN